ncbi:MAG: hypothetical protein AABY22_10445 [Nanoarchaeota archaeon]
MNIIRGKSPLRLSLAGGGTDFPEIFNEFGGMVISSTIDKFCHASIEKRDDKLIYINNKLLNKNNKIIQTIINNIQSKYGFNLIYYNDIEPGSGMGNSSSFTALIISLILELEGKTLDDRELVELTYKIENQFSYGGWQDLFSTIMGGFNFMEFEKDRKTVYPLRIKYRTICELEENLMIIKLPKRQTNGGDIQKIKYENMSNEYRDRLLKTKDIANEIKYCLLGNNIQKIGELLHKTWELKRDKLTTNNEIDSIYDLAVKNGVIGGKVMGAGGGGHMLLFINPENRNNLISVLKNKGLGIVNFRFWAGGIETWKPYL